MKTQKEPSLLQVIVLVSIVATVLAVVGLGAITVGWVRGVI